MLENHQSLLNTLTNEWHLNNTETVDLRDSLHSLLFEIIIQLQSQNIDIQYDDNYYYTKWMPTDTPTLYAENIRDQAQRQWLNQLGWIDSDITYRINKFGFRCDDFSQSDKIHRGIVVLGCSYTQGTGLLPEQVYTSLLEQHFGCKVWNLGVSGVDTKPLANFALFHMLDYIEPDAIVFTIPPGGRYRQLANFSNDEMDTYKKFIFGMHGKKYEIASEPDLNDTTMNYVRDMMAVKALGQDLGIPFVANTANVLSDINDPVVAERYHWDRARDLMHFGPAHHRRWADKLIRELEPQLR
jgi:hypothetical protein